MPDIGLNEDFQDLLTALVDAKAEFVLIGGWAMALHGHGRGTDDMDVLVRPSAENAQRVFSALHEFGAPVSAHGVKTVVTPVATIPRKVGGRATISSATKSHSRSTRTLGRPS